MKLGADGALYANGRLTGAGPRPPVETVRGRDRGRGRVLRRVPARPGWTRSRPGEALGSGCRLAANALGLVGARPAADPGPARCSGAAGPRYLDEPVLPGRPGSRGHRREFRHRPRDGPRARPGRRPGRAAGPRRGRPAWTAHGHPAAAGGTVAWVGADLVDPAEAERAAGEAAAAFGEPDILVNCGRRQPAAAPRRADAGAVGSDAGRST